MNKTKSKLGPVFETVLVGLMIIAAIMLLAFLSSLLGKDSSGSVGAFNPTEYTVVIDAGHGGEDGGTSSVDGIKEKELNLIFSKKLESLFKSAGVNTVMTRSEDKLLYDPLSDYKGRKKILDAKERIRIVNEQENPLFISIHMNAFPESKYKGLQVYYSRNDPFSAYIAEAVQTKVSELLQPNNERKIKAARDIFLLDRISSPAILIECGFLSNPEEAKLLTQEEYQNLISFVVFYSILAKIQ